MRGFGQSQTVVNVSLLEGGPSDPGIAVSLDQTCFSMLLRIHSINVRLLAEEEKVGVEKAFRTLLHSISYPIQIYSRKVVHSNDEYLAYLMSLHRQERSPQVQRLIKAYYEHIARRSTALDFFEQEFYLVLPYRPAGAATAKTMSGLTSAWASVVDLLPGAKRGGQRIDANLRELLRDARRELNMRVNVVESALTPIGVKPQALSAAEIATLYYSIYAHDQYEADIQRGSLAERVGLATVHLTRGGTE